MRDRNLVKPLFFVAILVASVCFYFFAADDYLTLEYVKSRLEEIRQSFNAHPVRVVAMYCGLYVFLTSLSIPGTIVLTLLSGAIFGTAFGTLIVVSSATIGATIAFLLARYLFKDYVRTKFHTQFEKINQKFVKEGSTYLFILRMIPVSPYVVINNVMGLTSIGAFTYMAVTFFGMLPGTFIYVLAGRKMAQIQEVSEIMSWPIILSLSLIGLFPIFARKLVRLIRGRHQHLGEA